MDIALVRNLQLALPKTERRSLAYSAEAPSKLPGVLCARCHGCRANHPLLDAALATLEEALKLPKVQPFDHKDPASTEPSLRHVELTLEGSTGRVQLVLLWNGQRGSCAPGLGIQS